MGCTWNPEQPVNHPDEKTWSISADLVAIPVPPGVCLLQHVDSVVLCAASSGWNQLDCWTASGVGESTYTSSLQPSSPVNGDYVVFVMVYWIATGLSGQQYSMFQKAHRVQYNDLLGVELSSGASPPGAEIVGKIEPSAGLGAGGDIPLHVVGPGWNWGWFTGLLTPGAASMMALNDLQAGINTTGPMLQRGGVESALRFTTSGYHRPSIAPGTGSPLPSAPVRIAGPQGAWPGVVWDPGQIHVPWGGTDWGDAYSLIGWGPTPDYRHTNTMYAGVRRVMGVGMYLLGTCAWLLQLMRHRCKLYELAEPADQGVPLTVLD